MNKINYQKELDKIIEDNEENKPSLLLHSCCAPCSSYVLEYLTKYFDITVFYFNPNISPEEEYIKRVNEVKRLIREMPSCKNVKLIEGRYCKDEFFNYIKGFEGEREGGARCVKCFELRLEETAKLAKEIGADYFCSTLTISPLKNADNINAVGEKMADRYRIKWLPSDFKKREGYKRSIELSEEYSLFRQNYCGCVFSKGDL